MRRYFICSFVSVLVALPVAMTADNAVAETVTAQVFHGHNIHFNPDSADLTPSDQVSASDNGREIGRSVMLPEFEPGQRITAHLVIHPIPKDPLAVYDKWDRAGNVRLRVPGQADIELVKFVTAYGGYTEHEADVSHLASLLQGECELIAFIDTWVSPAWKVDFNLSFEPDSADYLPEFAAGLIYEPSFDREHMVDTGVTMSIAIPPGLDRVMLYYLVSGHCTDGRGADEFVSKDNVIAVDDIVVHRYRPWRDDCRQFREINPYTKRWSDGYWSSDYSRSGWCPGDVVAPLELDLSDHLTPGLHEVHFRIEDIRPDNDKGDHGYWRVSAHVVGYVERHSDQN